MIGQGFFILFMAVLLFTWKLWLDLIYSIIGIVYGGFVIILGCKYPLTEQEEDFEKKRKELEK